MAHDPLFAAAEVGEAMGVFVTTGVSVTDGAGTVGLGASVGVGYEQAERRRVRIKRLIFLTANILFKLTLPFVCRGLIPFLKCDGKNTAFPRYAFDVQGPVMLFDHLPGDGKSQPDAVEELVPAPV